MSNSWWIYRTAVSSLLGIIISAYLPWPKWDSNSGWNNRSWKMQPLGPLSWLWTVHLTTKRLKNHLGFLLVRICTALPRESSDSHFSWLLLGRKDSHLTHGEITKSASILWKTYIFEKTKRSNWLHDSTCYNVLVRLGGPQIWWFLTVFSWQVGHWYRTAHHLRRTLVGLEKNTCALCIQKPTPRAGSKPTTFGIPGKCSATEPSWT